MENVITKIIFQLLSNEFLLRLNFRLGFKHFFEIFSKTEKFDKYALIKKKYELLLILMRKNVYYIMLRTPIEFSYTYQRVFTTLQFF